MGTERWLSRARDIYSLFSGTQAIVLRTSETRWASRLFLRETQGRFVAPASWRQLWEQRRGLISKTAAPFPCIGMQNETLQTPPSCRPTCLPVRGQLQGIRLDNKSGQNWRRRKQTSYLRPVSRQRGW